MLHTREGIDHSADVSTRGKDWGGERTSVDVLGALLGRKV